MRRNLYEKSKVRTKSLPNVSNCQGEPHNRNCIGRNVPGSTGSLRQWFFGNLELQDLQTVCKESWDPKKSSPYLLDEKWGLRSSTRMTISRQKRQIFRPVEMNHELRWSVCYSHGRSHAHAGLESSTCHATRGQASWMSIFGQSVSSVRSEPPPASCWFLMRNESTRHRAI